MNIEQKVFHYKHTKCNITFRELHHTVVTVCEFVKPIYPNIKPLEYLEYFFTEIDFDKIGNEASKKENLKYCNAIYFGLEQFKADISKAILNYQNNISKLSKEQVQETQIKLIELIGNLKRQARTNEAGISFTQRYNALYKSIESKEKLFHIDYQILITNFNEIIVNDLLSSFEIINETFDKITPLLKALPPQQTKTKTNKIKASVLGLFCSLINKIGIDKKDETESATVYCERICNKFKLPYTDRVRQNYNVNETKKLIQELTEKVLPLIDNETKNLVRIYLDSKQLPKQNLYG